MSMSIHFTCDTTHGVWESLLESLGDVSLDRLWDSRLSLGVGSVRLVGRGVVGHV